MPEHKTEQRKREIKEIFCAEPACEFKGKHAQQGICYSARGEIVEWPRLEAAEKRIVEELKSLRKTNGRRYVEALEAYYISAALNWEITLDECIRLRRDNALLKLRKRRR